MSKTKKGLTLVELLVSIVLLGFIVGSATLYGRYIGIIQSEVDKKAIVSMARLGSGVEYMIQRMLHSDNNPAIDADRKGVTFTVIYGGKGRKARIYFDENKKELLYDYNINDNTPPKTFLKDIEHIAFIEEGISKDDKGDVVEKRLAVEIQAIHDPYPINIRTSVIGRNRPTPRGITN